MLGLTTTQLTIAGIVAAVAAMQAPRLIPAAKWAWGKIPAVPSIAPRNGVLRPESRLRHLDAIVCDLRCRGEASAASKIQEAYLPYLLDKQGDV